MSYQIKVYGKEFSKETILLRKYLNSKNIDYDYIDLEFEEDENVLNWFKSEKFMSIPVFRFIDNMTSKNYLVVGFYKNSIDRILFKLPNR